MNQHDKYRWINTSFWDDTFIGELKSDEKLLFLYLLTNPLTQTCGVYQISLKRIRFDTDLEEERIKEILKKFEDSEKIVYSDGWMLILNTLKHQKYEHNNTKKRIIAELVNLPKPKFDIFLEKNKIKNPNLTIFDEIKANVEQEQEQEQEQEKNKKRTKQEDTKIDNGMVSESSSSDSLVKEKDSSLVSKSSLEYSSLESPISNLSLLLEVSGGDIVEAVSSSALFQGTDKGILNSIVSQLQRDIRNKPDTISKYMEDKHLTSESDAVVRILRYRIKNFKVN